MGRVTLATTPAFGQVLIGYQLVVVIAAVAQHQSPLALGNVIGSVISNILAAFSLGLLFQRGHVQFDRSSQIYVILLLVLTPPVIVLGYFGKAGVIFGSVLIAVFGLYFNWRRYIQKCTCSAGARGFFR